MRFPSGKNLLQKSAHPRHKMPPSTYTVEKTIYYSVKVEGGICHEKTHEPREKTNRPHRSWHRGGYAHRPSASVVVLVAGDRDRVSLRRDLAVEAVSGTIRRCKRENRRVEITKNTPGDFA